MAKGKPAVEEVETNDPSSKIEAIKNLIFGENIATYNSEFEHVKKEITTQKKELEAFIESTRQELLQSIDNLSTDINIRITTLEETLEDKITTLDTDKVDRNVLGDLLIAMGEKINKK